MSLERACIRAGRLPIVGSLAAWTPAVGWLDFEARYGADNIHLPSDLYTVSLRCDEDDAAGVTAVVYSVREKPRRFGITDRRQAVVAALNPVGMLKAFGLPAVELLDRPLPIEALCGQAAGQDLARSLHAAPSLEQRALVFAGWLEQRMHEAGTPSAGAARAVRAAAEWSADPTRHGIEDMARSLGIAVRQLERDFQRSLHVTPSTYRRIVKFQRAAWQVAQGHRLADVSADHAFTDQAHMTHVFRQFALLTPGELARYGARSEWHLVRAALAERVFLLDLAPPAKPADHMITEPSPAQRPAAGDPALSGHGAAGYDAFRQLLQSAPASIAALDPVAAE